MALIETEETNRFTYERFAAHTFYTDVNRSLVKQALAHLPERAGTLTIVDMACGTGAVTRLVAEELAQQGRLDRAHLIGVDPSAEALRHARIGMDEMGLEPHSEFIQGDAEDLPNIVSNADAAFFCNAIHLVPDKRTAFEQMSTILAPGGIFACNSAFYEGTYIPGTERFYRLWTRRAVGWLKNTSSRRTSLTRSESYGDAVALAGRIYYPLQGNWLQQCETVQTTGYYLAGCLARPGSVLALH